MLIGIKNNKIISKINKFIDGRWFAPAFAAFILTIHCLSLDVAGYVLSVLLFAYINVFCDDVRPVFAIAFLAPMAASEKHAPGYEHGDGYYVSTGVTVAISVCVVIVVAAVIYRFIAFKGYKNLFKKASLSVGLIAFSATLLTAGLFSKYWSVDSLFVAGMVIGTSLVFYVYAATSLAPREDNLRYIGRLCAVTTVEILIQLLIFYIGNFDFSSGVLDSEWKGNIIIGWGISNSIGEFLVFMLAGVLSLAYTEERGFVYYVLAMLSLVGAYFTLSRCAVLIGVGVFAVGSVAIAIASKEKQKNRLLLLIFLAALAFAIAFLARTERIDGFFKFFKDSGLGDRGRFGLWKEFMGLWKEYPVLGTGFAAFKKIHSSPSVFHNFAHNTIVQILSSAGIVGLLGYIIHRIQTVKLFVSKPTINRLYLVLGVVAYVVMGLIDTITFFASFIVVYTIFLVCIEKDLAFCLETQNGEKVNEET